MSDNNNMSSNGVNSGNNNVGTTRSVGVMPVSIQGMLIEANADMRDNELFNMEISAELMKDYSTAVVGVVQMGLDSAHEAAKATKWSGMSSAIGTGISGGIGLVATGMSYSSMPTTSDLDEKIGGNKALQEELNRNGNSQIVARAPQDPMQETAVNERIEGWKKGIGTETYGSDNLKMLEKSRDDLAVELMSPADRDTVSSKITENNKSLEAEREGRFSTSNNTIRNIDVGNRALGEIAQAGGKTGESFNQATTQKAQANTEVLKQVDQQLYSSISSTESKMNQFVNDANQVAAQIYVQVHA